MREVDQLIATRYAPVSVIINDQMQILNLRGDTNPYLNLPTSTAGPWGFVWHHGQVVTGAAMDSEEWSVYWACMPEITPG